MKNVRFLCYYYSSSTIIERWCLAPWESVSNTHARACDPAISTFLWRRVCGLSASAKVPRVCACVSSATKKRRMTDDKWQTLDGWKSSTRALLHHLFIPPIIPSCLQSFIQSLIHWSFVCIISFIRSFKNPFNKPDRATMRPGCVSSCI